MYEKQFLHIQTNETITSDRFTRLTKWSILMEKIFCIKQQIVRMFKRFNKSVPIGSRKKYLFVDVIFKQKTYDIFVHIIACLLHVIAT